MRSTDLAAVILRITTDKQTSEDVEFALGAYEPLLDKYTAILMGKFTSGTGKNFLADENVKMFAYAFKRGGNTLRTLQWVVDQCKHFGYEEVKAEVVSSFLECLRLRGQTTIFPTILAQNIAQLIGNPMEILVEDLDQVARVEEFPDIVSKAEGMLFDRGIILTQRERDLIHLLSVQFDLGWAAEQMGISKQRVSALLLQLREKASL